MRNAQARRLVAGTPVFCEKNGNRFLARVVSVRRVVPIGHSKMRVDVSVETATGAEIVVPGTHVHYLRPTKQ